MSALKGSLSYVRFFVEGELPDGFRDRFVKAILLRAMKPLEPDEDVLERWGWVKIGDPFETDLDYEGVFYNEYVNLGCRVDRWQIPAPMLRAKVREAEAAYLAKKGRDRLARKEKAELKELVARKLRRQMNPVTRSFDLSWSLQEGIVRFFSQAGKPAAAMQELFGRTFGLKLVPEAPYTLAARLGLTKAQEEAWQKLEPISLAPAEVA